MNLHLDRGRFITALATTDDINSRGDRFLLEGGAVSWAPRVPVLLADRPDVQIGEVFRFRLCPENIMLSALIDDEAPRWAEICSGACSGVAIGYRAEQCHRNAFGGVTFDRWTIEEILIMPPGWPCHDRAAQIISADEGGKELRFGYRVWPRRPVQVTPRSEEELQRLLGQGHALR